MKKKTPELLSPAGSMDALKAAINGGADAVYLGLKEFSARKRANNFDYNELDEALEVAHGSGVKVYVAFNTLVKDSEFKDALKALNKILKAGADGVIIQDLGLLDSLLKQKREGNLGDFSVQLSTQASVYGKDGFELFEDMGLDRIVVARETDIRDIKRIASSEKAETKIFGHGALCYAYSGQCHLSTAIGTRSGNRGGCAQPCRKWYTLSKNGREVKSGFLLSTKELNTLDQIKRIKRSGVDSIKIEGRMRSPEYVYAATKAYRDALDGEEPNLKDIEAAFSRDFTEGAIFGSHHNLSQGKAKKRGRPIGLVGEINGDVTEICLGEGVTLLNGDGLSFGEDENIGFYVSGMFNEDGEPIKEGTGSVWIRSPQRLHEGMPVSRSFDKATMDRLKRKALKKPWRDKTPLDMTVLLKEWSVPILTVTDGEREATVIGEDELEMAQNIAATEEDIYSQLIRLGDTDFTPGKITVDLDDGLFVPKSVLNSLRQQAVQELMQMKEGEGKPEAPEIKFEAVEPRKREGAPKLSVRFEDLPEIGLIKGLKPDEVVLNVKDLSKTEELRGLIPQIRELGAEVLLTFPTVMDSAMARAVKESEVLDLVDAENPNAAQGFLVPNYELLNILIESGKDGSYLEADESLNVFNAHSAAFLKDLSFDALTLSEELEAKEVKTLSKASPIDVTLDVAGKRRLMVSANCVMDCVKCHNCPNEGWYELENANGDEFLLRIEGGKNFIYNKETTEIPKAIREQPFVDKFRFNITNESNEEALEIAERLKSALNGEAVDLEVKPGNYRMEVE